MTEAEARLALAPITEGERVFQFTDQWAYWVRGYSSISLEGGFTADQLEALAWWMRNMGKK